MFKARKKTIFAVISVNAGIDRIIRLPEPLNVGGMNRAVQVETCAGSKGANVAILLRHLGAEVTYVAVTGGESARICNAFTELAGIPCRFVETVMGVRTNIKIISPDGVATECNERGGPMSPAECDGFLAAVAQTQADVYLLCGSLPAGAPDGYYGDMIRAIRENHPDTKVILDCSGAAFRAAMDTAPPDLIKPNRKELAELLSLPEPETREQALALCRLCRERYAKTALLCTLGAKGAIYLGEDGEYDVTQPAAEHPRLTVGAGDTFLGGFLSALDARKGLREALRVAAAAASVHVGLSAGVLPGKEEILAQTRQIHVQKL